MYGKSIRAAIFMYDYFYVQNNTMSSDELMDYLGVKRRSMQYYLAEINNYLADQMTGSQIVFDRSLKVYKVE